MSTGQEIRAVVPDKVATVGMQYQHGRPRQIHIKLPAQIILIMHEGRASDGELISAAYEWQIRFQGRIVLESAKKWPTEASATRAAQEAARDWARRWRESASQQVALWPT